MISTASHEQTLNRRAPRTKHAAAFHRGFTLAELVVVLMILAIMATVAVQALTPVAEQVRFQATQKIMEQIREAIVSSDDSGTAGSAVRGFVADTGRLPHCLAELVTISALPPAFEPKLDNYSSGTFETTGETFAAVAVSRGWRGPYLRLPMGTSELKDGWGTIFGLEPLTTVSDDTTASLAILRPQSPTDAVPPTEPAFVLSPHEYQGTVIVNLYRKGSSGERLTPTETWNVKLLGPGPNDVKNGVKISDPSTTTTSSTTGPMTVQFNNVLIGPKVICTLKSTTLTGNPVHFTVRPGTTHTLDLIVEVESETTTPPPTP